VRRRLLPFALAAACSSGGGDTIPANPTSGSNLSGFAVGRITINGIELEVWRAQSGAQHAQGLMFATPDQLAPLSDGTERGMLFEFASPFFLSFWMRNTFIPLDLAYIRADGTIAEIHSLLPLDETSVVASELVQFALEVRAGTLAALGIQVGDRVTLPVPP